MFKSCLDLVTFPRPREHVTLQSNSVCCLFGRRPLFRGQVWMVSQKPQKGSGIVLPITAISTHGPNLPSEVARSTSNSSHKHLRTTSQVDIHRVESTSMSTRFRSAWICRRVTNHTHTRPHSTRVTTRFLYTTYVSTRWFCTWFRPCVYIHIQPSENISSARIVYVHSMSVHMGESIGFHTHTTHTNEPRKPGKHKTSGSHMVSSGCCRTHSTHTNAPQKPRGTSSNQPQLCVHSNSFLLVLLVRSKNTHTHIPRPTPPTCANPGAGRNTAIPGKRRFGRCPEQLHFGQRCFRLCPRASAVLDVARNGFISGSAVLGSARNEPIPGKRCFGRCPE